MLLDNKLELLHGAFVIIPRRNRIEKCGSASSSQKPYAHWITLSPARIRPAGAETDAEFYQKGSTRESRECARMLRKRFLFASIRVFRGLHIRAIRVIRGVPRLF